MFPAWGRFSRECALYKEWLEGALRGMCTSRPNFRGHGAPGRPTRAERAQQALRLPSRLSRQLRDTALRAKPARKPWGCGAQCMQDGFSQSEPLTGASAVVNTTVLLKHSSIELPHKPAIPLLGISSKEWKV